MSPNGFNSKVIDNALNFTAECFSDLQKEVSEGKHRDFKSGVEYELYCLNITLNRSEKNIDEDLNSTFKKSKGAILGSLIFIRGCYKDLLRELSDNVPDDDAIKNTLANMKNSLEKVYINERGYILKKD